MRAKRARSRKSAVINNSRWMSYATAGAATALIGANAAEGAIHDVTVNQPFSGNQASNFQLDQPGDFIRFSHSTSSNAARFGINQGVATFHFRGYSHYGFLGASRLNSGQKVSAVASAFQSGKGLLAKSGAGQFANAGPDQFVGFEFNNGSGVEYGWARLTMDGSGAGNTFTLVDYAWGDVGDSITAGQTQVPEPGSLGLLALGGAGLLAWRNRRAKTAV